MAPPLPSLFDFFGRQGLLARAHPQFEYRSGQLEMARAVEAALADRRHLLIEAGTGTGKTLAYLLPVLRSGRRVLLSTGTRNLQEQLVKKDVPLLAAALGRELDVITVKGRQNYACKAKIESLESQPALLDLQELDEYRRIRAWTGESEFGDQEELEFLRDAHPLWRRLNARRETCTGQKCPRFNDCFVTLLRQRASTADLVVVNHHLFFADLMLKTQQLDGVLPPYEAVVFDEAHELESTAGQYFGVTVSSHQLDELARDAGAVLRAGGLATPELEMRLARARAACDRLLNAAAMREGRFPFLNRDSFQGDNQAMYDEAAQALAALRAGLEAIAPKPEELHALLARLVELQRRLAYLLESQDPNVVFWVERRRNGVFLQASPIEVAPLLRETLFRLTDTVILTSATLTVGGDFEYLRGRLGLDTARAEVVSSPFRYREQALLYLAAHLPEPAQPDFVPRAAAEIESLLAASQGRAFVLCTSLEAMRQFHARLRDKLPWPLLLQGEAPRHLLLERFRHTPHAVLFATASFWQGVDVPGEALSCVIVDRLPFAVPNDPVVAARVRSLQQQGRNAFLEFQVPEAVLALKQGVGRLIRSTRDRGVVALLDSRIMRKPYGAQFLRSLPEFACTIHPNDVRRFFEAGEMPANAFYAGPQPRDALD